MKPSKALVLWWLFWLNTMVAWSAPPKAPTIGEQVMLGCGVAVVLFIGIPSAMWILFAVVARFMAVSDNSKPHKADPGPIDRSKANQFAKTPSPKIEVWGVPTGESSWEPSDYSSFD